MTKLRDSQTAAGAFRKSVSLLEPDPTVGDDGAARVARLVGHRDVGTVYKWQSPSGHGPPIGVAELVDELHRQADGIEHNLEAWLERRGQRVAGQDGERGHDPGKLIESAISEMDDAAKALRAGLGDAQEVWLLSTKALDSYADLAKAITERWHHEGERQNRRAEDHRPFRRTTGTGPKLVRDGGGR